MRRCVGPPASPSEAFRSASTPEHNIVSVLVSSKLKMALIIPRGVDAIDVGIAGLRPSLSGRASPKCSAGPFITIKPVAADRHVKRSAVSLSQQIFQKAL